MMTDRELLELAAKAAGYPLMAHSIHAHKVCLGGVEWNPLTDDGDALRLAAKLKIDIDWQSTDDLRPTPHVEAYIKSDGPHFCALEHEGDYRLAIVRAAAEIGRAK